MPPRPPDGMHFAITHGHQLPDPLAVQHIGLAPRHLARRSRIHRCTSNPRASRTSSTGSSTPPSPPSPPGVRPTLPASQLTPQLVAESTKRRTDSSAHPGAPPPNALRSHIDPRAVRINDIQPLLALRLPAMLIPRNIPMGAQGTRRRKFTSLSRSQLTPCLQRLHADAAATLFDGCDHTSEEPASSLRTRRLPHPTFATRQRATGTAGTHSDHSKRSDSAERPKRFCLKTRPPAKAKIAGGARSHNSPSTPREEHRRPSASRRQTTRPAATSALAAPAVRLSAPPATPRAHRGWPRHHGRAG